MPVVRLSRLSKSYGTQQALIDVGLDIEAGEVFGYLGPNGAGKTTTIRILLGLLRPTSGSAELFGHDTWTESVLVHARTGYVPGDPGLWERMTGEATVRYLASLRNDPAQVARAHGSPTDSASISPAGSARCRRATSRRWSWSKRSWANPTSSSSTSRRPGSTHWCSRSSTP